MGLDGLRPHDELKVKVGNIFMYFTCAVLRLALRWWIQESTTFKAVDCSSCSSLVEAQVHVNGGRAFLLFWNSMEKTYKSVWSSHIFGHHDELSLPRDEKGPL